jgi:hypothetical protein
VRLASFGDHRDCLVLGYEGNPFDPLFGAVLDQP